MAAVVVQEWYGGDSPHLAIDCNGEQARLVKTVNIQHAGGTLGWTRPSVPTSVRVGVACMQATLGSLQTRSPVGSLSDLKRA